MLLFLSAFARVFMSVWNFGEDEICRVITCMVVSGFFGGVSEAPARAADRGTTPSDTDNEAVTNSDSLLGPKLAGGSLHAWQPQERTPAWCTEAFIPLP